VIVGVAVCPGAPFLIAGTADAIARQVPDLADACRRAISGLPPADRLLLIATGPAAGRRSGGTVRRSAASPGWRSFPPGTPVTTIVTRHDACVRAVRLPSDPAVPGQLSTDGSDAAGRPAAVPSIATLVGTHLLAALPHPPPTTAVEVNGTPPTTSDLAERLGLGGSERIALVVIADGSACHGPRAPGRQDDRAAEFDGAVAGALATGDPAALRAACVNRGLPAGELMAMVAPLRLLAELADIDPPDTAEVLYAGAPFGVGYFVASWRWDRS
jgi:hypothetical protein